MSIKQPEYVQEPPACQGFYLLFWSRAILPRKKSLEKNIAMIVKVREKESDKEIIDYSCLLQARKNSTIQS